MSADDHFHRSPASGSPAQVNLDIGVDASSLYTLRAAVSAHASELGMGDRQLDKLLVVATELATNVIRYGGSAGRLRLWRSGDMLACQVDDDGPGMTGADQAGMQPVALGAVGGRGLWIVRQLCDQVTITSDGHGVTVIAMIAI